jgi:hypothetical protein
MPDQPSEPTDPSDDTRDQSGDEREPVERPSEPTPFAETLRAKLEEYDVERHLGDLASQLEDAVRQGVEAIGSLAHEHRDDVVGFLSRTAEALDRRTDGRHAETISEVRGQLERGVQRLAEQRSEGPTDSAPDLTEPTDPTHPTDPSGKD